MTEKVKAPLTKEELEALLLPYTDVIKNAPEALRGPVVNISVSGWGGSIHLEPKAFKTLFQEWNVNDTGAHYRLTAKLNDVEFLCIVRERVEAGL